MISAGAEIHEVAKPQAQPENLAVLAGKPVGMRCCRKTGWVGLQKSCQRRRHDQNGLRVRNFAFAAKVEAPTVSVTAVPGCRPRHMVGDVLSRLRTRNRLKQRANQPLQDMTAIAHTLSRKALETLLRDKGWTILNAAQYLGVSRQYLYNQFDDLQRPRLVQCAILGLPECSADIAAELKTQRDRIKAARQPKQRQVEPTDELGGRFQVGEGVSADRNVGEFVDEGDEGWIKEKFVTDEGMLTYVIDFGEKGIETFPEAMANHLFVQNGKTVPSK